MVNRHRCRHKLPWMSERTQPPALARRWLPAAFLPFCNPALAAFGMEARAGIETLERAPAWSEAPRLVRTFGVRFSRSHSRSKAAEPGELRSLCGSRRQRISHSLESAAQAMKMEENHAVDNTYPFPSLTVAWPPACCYLYATAHRAPATTDSGACLCSCRRGALCVTHIYACECRAGFDSMGDEEGYVYIFTNELAVAACAKDRRSLSTRPRAAGIAHEYGTKTARSRRARARPCEHADRVFPCDVLQVRVTRSVCIGV